MFCFERVLIHGFLSLGRIRNRIGRRLMSLKEEQIKMAEMIERYEIGLGYLYQACAEIFPECSAFWDEISMEERTHAYMIRVFRSMVEDGSIDAAERQFKADEVMVYIRDLDEHLGAARRREVSLTEALAVALEMESRSIEQHIFTVFSGDSEELKRVLTMLDEDTRKHYARSKELYEEKIGE